MRTLTLAWLLGTVGCFEYRATAPSITPAAVGTKAGGEVIWSVAWGLARQTPKIDCNDQPLSEVTVRDNLGFSLLTIVTLGLVSPKKIEWRCATPRPSEGGLRPPGSDR